MDFLREMVKGVRVDTAWLPPIEIQDPFAPSPGAPSPLLQLLRPKLTVTLASGSEVVVAPYGEPGPTRWPWIKGLLVAAGLGLLLLAAKKYR